MIKTFIRLLLGTCILLMVGACIVTTPTTKKVPPGQAKKMTGSQSAKPFAPGQQKKKN